MEASNTLPRFRQRMKINRITGGILLITGTCIGAGMLALPITTAASGFGYSALLLVVTWLAMYLTGLYVLEVNLLLPPGANFISMAKETLGKTGDIVAWVTYLLLLYSLMAAYLSGGGDIVNDTVKTLTGIGLQEWVAPLPWVLGGAIIIYVGVRFVDEINRLLMGGLILTYFLMVLMTSSHVELSYFKQGSPYFLLAALPVIITSFGYHVIIPSLRVYLAGDSFKLKRIIFWGSLLPLCVYLLWEFLVFGIIPVEGRYGLAAILQSGHPASDLTHSLSLMLQNTWIVKTAEFFIFFAIATSFLGISLSLFDFLSDGLHIPKTARGKALAALITFAPPLTFALLFPRGFILALSYAGVFVAILHGILPAGMVLAARKKNLHNGYRAPLGLYGIVIILCFSLLIIFAQLAVNFHWLRSF